MIITVCDSLFIRITPTSSFSQVLHVPRQLSVQLCRWSHGQEVSVLHLFIDGLGTELKLRTFDMSSFTFLSEICLECSEYLVLRDSEDKKVHLITTLDNTEEDLLMLEYIKVDKTAPEFKTGYNNTEQLIKVNFSSLDVHLHTEALLNSMNFLNSLLPQLKTETTEQQPVLIKVEEEEEQEEETKSESSSVTRTSSYKKSKFEDVVSLHIRADLNCLKVFIRGERARISEIIIEGLVSEVQMKKKSVEILANLKNIVILDCDREALYKKAVSIAGKEVFDFRLVNHVEATEGEGYTDMNIVDTSVSLTVGCIQLIFLNKFMSSILAAEKAATGVLELAERSTRISMDVDIKAPVVFLPQSSVSHNVIVADLGLVTVKNHFEMVSSPTHTKIPPVMDIMTVRLSDLKMYRTMFRDGEYRGEIQLLKPVNMDLSIKRNLSASWYHSIPDVQIKAHLKPMSLILSQEDLTVVLKTLSENLSETSEVPLDPISSEKADTVSSKDSQGSGGNTVVTAAVVEGQKTGKLKNTLKLDFKFDSMTLVVYSPNHETPLADCRDESLKLAEFTLGTISTSVDMFSDGSMKASLKLATCLLDDKRQKVKMITSRMMAMRQGSEGEVMVDVSYRQSREGTRLDTLVQDLYLCASVEFLMTVADVFLKALSEGFSGSQKSSKPASSSSRDTASPAPAVSARSELNVIVRNPEVVFVADLTRAAAPSLVVTLQCELQMRSDPGSQTMSAAVSQLKVMACPFLRQDQEHSVTTVLQPCQVFLQSRQTATEPQAVEISISSLTLKVSPIIINTVITIQSALTPAAETPEALESPVLQDLWERRNLRDLKLWFLEEEGEGEEVLTRSHLPLLPQGESLNISLGSICVTLEAGVGHRTVPMLLAKASFQGDVKNWTTLINLHCHLNLEVNYYNEMMGLWEPLLEPLDDEEKDGFRPWSLALKMKKKPVSESGVSDVVDGPAPDYKTVISLASKDQLNITLSKCGLNMLSNLGTAFAEATKQTAERFETDQAPFVVKNRLGLAVSVLHSEVFRPIGKESRDHLVELQDGESLNMDYTFSTESSDQFSAMTSLSTKNYIQPTPVGHTSARVIPLIKTGRGMYSVMHLDSRVTRFFICQIYSVQGSKYIKIRSPFQVNGQGSACLGVSLPMEEFCVPLGSYRSELKLQPVTEGEERYDFSESFSYSEVLESPGDRLEKTCHLHGDAALRLKINMVALPDNVMMSHSSEGTFDKPIVLHLWPTVLLRNLLPYPISCKLKDSGEVSCRLLEEGHSCQFHTAILDSSSLQLRLMGYLEQDWEGSFPIRSEQEEISFIRGIPLQYVVTLAGPFQEHHQPPGADPGCPVDTLRRGGRPEVFCVVTPSHTLAPRTLTSSSPGYVAGLNLKCLDHVEFESLRVEEDSDGNSRPELDIGVHVQRDEGQLVLAMHSPYWMLNRTGRLLQYKADDIHRKHPKDYDKPLLFSFKPRNFLQNNKIRLMISESELSDEFSIDTVGSYGDVRCKGRHKDYLVGVKIDSTSFSLTRLVTFLPFYLLLNRTKHLIHVSEEAQETWTEARPGQAAVPFWPERESKKLRLGGIIIEVNLMEHSTVICFSDYHDGAAPFLLINHTREETLQYHQSSQAEMAELTPGQAVYYTWSEPTGSRTISWRCGKYSGELKSEEDLLLDMNQEGELFVVSLYEGLQRVALFTNERRVFKKICEGEKMELAQQEISILFQNMGISLVNNSSSQEVAFIGITRYCLQKGSQGSSHSSRNAGVQQPLECTYHPTPPINGWMQMKPMLCVWFSSDVVWETKPKKRSRWKVLSLKEAEALEQRYREYMERGPVDSCIIKMDNYQVLFAANGEEMRVLQPYDAPLRRSFLPAVKVEYSVWTRQKIYRIRINHIQIQNQLSGAIFPFVFYPVKPPRSVRMDSEPKPLADVSIITRAAGHSDILRIKYFKVLIQEMDLRLDLGFLYALLELFTAEHLNAITAEQQVELFEKDVEYLKTELNHASAADTSPISLYEYFHISPIKVSQALKHKHDYSRLHYQHPVLHLSFSLSSGGEDGNKKERE
ncbi:hypothetical protein DNTS_026184, partial [Danionella cerebrum]